MAFRIHDSIVRGEIDNRQKGIVRGKIWLEGRAEAMTLELKGNAHPDLAGCLLQFTNLGARFADAHLDSLVAIQRGAVGDMTASRKARVLDAQSEHLANALYLEWFSERNGRVVIESTNYEMTVSPPQWQLTEEENEQRANEALKAMQDFLRKLTERIEHHQRTQKDPDADWNEHDFERFLKESDARTEKYGELLDKYGTSDEAEDKLAHEMGWDRELSDEEAARRTEWVEEMNRACQEALSEPEPEPDPHREGIDWIRTGDGDLRHPLQHACFENAMGLYHEVKALGLENHADSDLADLVSEFQIASAKLAGALGGLARGQPFDEAPFTVACLKRALNHLHKAQAGLESVASKDLLPVALVTGTRRQLFEIREGVLDLMDRLRHS
jgi:hypothetical protein